MVVGQGMIVPSSRHCRVSPVTLVTAEIHAVVSVVTPSLTRIVPLEVPARIVGSAGTGRVVSTLSVTVFDNSVAPFKLCEALTDQFVASCN